MSPPHKLAVVLGLLTTFRVWSDRLVNAQKLTAEELIARHLEAIANEKERAAISTRIISGTAQVIFRTTPLGQALARPCWLRKIPNNCSA
jgi:hypothetical protein